LSTSLDTVGGPHKLGFGLTSKYQDSPAKVAEDGYVSDEEEKV